MIKKRLRQGKFQNAKKGYWTSKTVRDVLLDKTYMKYDEEHDRGCIIIGKTYCQSRTAGIKTRLVINALTKVVRCFY